jgi:hypothetical protein
MTIEEIYTELSKHILKGIMIHEQLANYYDFLGLKGYKRCHEYHFLDEICEYRALCRYYVNHHNKTIPQTAVDAPTVIPESWYRYTRQEVDNGTKKSAVKNGLTVWVDWERETKTLYEKMYKEALEIGEVASAIKIKELVCGVDCELKKAERYQLDKKAIDYDLDYIISEQAEKHKKYKKKEKKLGVSIC